MAKIMKTVAVCSLLSFILSLLMYRELPLPALLSLCITLGTVSYHFWMRLWVGQFYDRFMQNKAKLSRSYWQLHSWEKKLYKKLKVKNWKGKMPSYDPELFSPKKHSWEEIAQAMCQAELVHSSIIPLSFLPLLASVRWGAFGVFLVTSLLAACYDAIFVIMQRYNRPRIMRLIEIERSPCAQ